MKIIKVFPIVLIILVFASCNDNRVYEEHTGDFPNRRWAKSKIVEFRPEIKDTAQRYKIYLALRHVYGFQHKTVDLIVDIISPSGEETSKKFILQVINNGGKYKAECIGDYCDLEVLFEDNYKFPETGKYKYSVKHAMPIDKILNVMEFGLIIDKIKK